MRALAPQENHGRAIRLWLLFVAALIFIMVLVGGATRLTESGLSIVEWRPVTGMLPPISQEQWQSEFEKYQAIPQYRTLNRGMSLDAFKTIYWWEWTHRFLGRFIGVAFLLPFLWFLWRGWIGAELRTRLWIIFGLGALQGAIGWWMVASGLAERVSVSPSRLATHLTLACIIFAAILWTAQGLVPREPAAATKRLRAGAVILLMLVLLQIFLGGLVAGLDAGLIYNTWPLIDGALVPSAERLWFLSPWWRNFFENTLTAQFDHRMLGYALWLGATVHVIDVVRTAGRGPILTGALALWAAMTMQAAVGILALLHQMPMSLALLHQAGAVIVLAVAVVHAERLARRQVAAKASDSLSMRAQSSHAA